VSYEIETSDGLRRLRTARETFLSDSRLPEDFPEWLASAWRRARFHGLDVDRPRVPSVSLAQEPELVRTAAPVLSQVAASLTGLHAAVVVSDARARIVGAWASDEVSRGHLDGIGTRAGADLSEPATGANGISHVLLTRRPTVIGGPGHLLALYQETVCAGAPIHGPRSTRPLGAIAVVARLDAPSPVLQALAATAAASVERELLHAATGQERRLLEAFLRAGRDGAAVAVLDGRTRLVNDAAAALLEPADLDTLEAHALAAAREGRIADPQLTLGRVEVRFTTATAADNPGVVATLVPRPKPSTPRSHRRSTPGLFARAGLAGDSPRWRSLESAVRRAAGRPLLLTGDPGVGKAAIAIAALGDPAVLEAEDTDGFVRRLTATVRNRRALVVRRLDRLSGLHAVRALTALANAPGRVAATWTLGGGVAAGLDEARHSWSPYELLVPPLRERVEDIATIATALVPEARFTMAALALLGRYDWPGNVTELQAVVRCATAAAATQPVRPEHLPSHLRAVAARPRLSELERAERDAIVEALRSTDGNRSHAAALLGIGRATLYRKLHRYRLD